MEEVQKTNILQTSTASLVSGEDEDSYIINTKARTDDAQAQNTFYEPPSTGERDDQKDKTKLVELS